MSHKFVSATVIATLIALAPNMSAAFTSKRGAKVNPVNAAVFEVVPRSGGSGQVYWCSAADYAQRQLRAPWTATLFIARGLGQSVTTGKRSAVQFTLDPQAAGVTPTGASLSLNSLKVGENMSVREAYNFCQKQSTF